MGKTRLEELTRVLREAEIENRAVRKTSRISDNINHPSHYTKGKIECIDVIDDQDMTFHAASALQYLWRYRFKGNPITDLKKCKWYIDREIKKLELNAGKSDKATGK